MVDGLIIQVCQLKHQINWNLKRLKHRKKYKKRRDRPHKKRPGS